MGEQLTVTWWSRSRPDVRSDFSRRFAVAGIGVVGHRVPDRTARALQVEAVRLAIEDAGLRREDIDGAIHVASDSSSEVLPTWSDAFPRILGLPTKFYIPMGRGGAMVAQSVVMATQMLHLGIAAYVVVAYGATDWQRRRARSSGKTTQKLEKTGVWGLPYGDSSAAGHHAFFMSRHMHEFGTTSEHLGAVAVQQRVFANGNPDANMYGRPLTIEDYLASPYLVEPYRALDMCQVSDTGIAFILTTAERARDLRKPPVYLLGVGFGEAIEHLWWEKANYTRLAVESAKRAAFEQAGLTLADVDIAQLYDCFTGEVILQVEDYGWCGKGEGGPFIHGGNTGPAGAIPINTGGGLLSAYAGADLPLLVETVVQLRGEGGARQKTGARVGLMSGHGGEMLKPGMCSTHATALWGN